MNGVAPSGYVDLARCHGSIRYQFRAKTASGDWLATATVVEGGMYTPILSSGPPDPVGRPTCMPEKVLAAARGAGAKSDPCATMEYRNRPSTYFPSPGWIFRGGGIEVVVDDACNVVPSPAELRAALDHEIDEATTKLNDNAEKRPRTREVTDEASELQQRLFVLRTRRTLLPTP
jgi:hypothetical protein